LKLLFDGKSIRNEKDTVKEKDRAKTKETKGFLEKIKQAPFSPGERRVPF
jgi:hypothetical protein